MERIELGQVSQAATLAADKAINELKLLESLLAEELSKSTEFFESALLLDHAARQTKQRKLKFFNQTALMQALLVRHEFKMKLQACLNGYLISVENKNAIMTYLSARYLLELLATISYIEFELNKKLQINLNDIEGRGVGFLLSICRARYSSSDPKIIAFLRDNGVSKDAIKAVNIKEAIKRLAERAEFSTAVSDYDFLSNICHHNGSSHQLFHHSIRNTSEIILQSGHIARLHKPGPAVTLIYPPTKAIDASLVQTANLALACCAWTQTIIDRLPLMPFTDEEVSRLTDGRLVNSLNYSPLDTIKPDSLRRTENRRVGRNHPCPCGSGKKYKNCCAILH